MLRPQTNEAVDLEGDADRALRRLRRNFDRALGVGAGEG